MKSQERAPDRVTLRYSPSPSEWRLGWAMVATALAESFLTAFPMSSPPYSPPADADYSGQPWIMKDRIKL